MRRYESASESAGKKKIEMFKQAGEIVIFKRTGLTPVFFGEALIGPMRPNLTYIKTFAGMAEHDKNWRQFGKDPERRKISNCLNTLTQKSCPPFHQPFWCLLRFPKFDRETNCQPEKRAAAVVE